MNRIIISAIIATGFHIAVIALMPSLLKENKITPQKAKPILITMTYKQPEIKEKIISKPSKPTPKPKPEPEPEPRPKKKLKQKKAVKTRQIKNEKEQNIQTIPKPVKKTKPEKRDSQTAITQKAAIKPQKNQISFAQPIYKANLPPAYPVKAKKRGQQGTVELMVLVSKKGKVTSIKIFESSGYKSLDQRALVTVKNWLFVPGKRDNIPEEMWIKIPIIFEIKQQ